MSTGMFAAGVITGLVGAAAAVMAVNYRLSGTELGQTVSHKAYQTAGAVSRAAQDAAQTVDKIVSG